MLWQGKSQQKLGWFRGTPSSGNHHIDSKVLLWRISFWFVFQGSPHITWLMVRYMLHLVLRETKIERYGSKPCCRLPETNSSLFKFHIQLAIWHGLSRSGLAKRYHNNHYWLVVWNMFVPRFGKNHSNWRTHIFLYFSEAWRNHQPDFNNKNPVEAWSSLRFQCKHHPSLTDAWEKHGRNDTASFEPRNRPFYWKWVVGTLQNMGKHCCGEWWTR